MTEEQIAMRLQWALTRRETETLLLLGKGMTNREIARLQSISLDTVNDRVSTVFRKLNVDRRVTAAVLACKAGLV